MFKDNQNSLDDTKTIIGAGVSVEGDFNGKGDVIVEGQLKGSIKTKQNVTIGEQALIEAEIEAANAYIAGRVKGNIKTEEKIELTKSAVVDGDITTKIISIEDGAIFNGHCSMQKEKKEDKTPEDLQEKGE